MPLHITSDCGVQFTSQLWTALSQRLGIHLHHTTAYHPQSNGLVERLHHHLKASLITRLKGSTWMDELPWVLMGIRTTPKEDLEDELVYGGTLTLLGEFAVPGVEILWIYYCISGPWCARFAQGLLLSTNLALLLCQLICRIPSLSSSAVMVTGPHYSRPMKAHFTCCVVLNIILWTWVTGTISSL